MEFTSDLAAKIISATGLRNIESAFFVGRHNGYFVNVEVQTRLSRTMMCISVSSLAEFDRRLLEEALSAKFSVSDYTILYEGNEIIILIPDNRLWIDTLRGIMDEITFFLADRHIPPDPDAEKDSDMPLPVSTPFVEYELAKPNYILGIFGSLLGSIPGAIVWFIFSIIGFSEYMVHTPEVLNSFSMKFLFSIIITCGSYWGFLLLSDASRKVSVLASAPITLGMIYAVNRFSYAFVFYSALSGLSIEEAFFSTPKLLRSNNLTWNYSLALLLGCGVSLITYLLLLRFRERGWKK
jgi:hypothetical protein